MTLTLRTELPDPVAYYDLFVTTRWNDEYAMTAADLERANRQSWFVVAAYSGDRLVGFGRIVSDSVLHAMIYDMIVAPDMQRQGVGSAILSALVQRCLDAGIPDIQLFCARGKEPFYLRHGFEKRPADAPGMQFVRGKKRLAANSREVLS